MRQIFILWISLASLFAQETDIVIRSKQIFLPAYPKAFNPSLIQTQDGFLLVFRYCPDPIYESWISYIGIVQLNEELDVVSEPQLLTTRRFFNKTPSQSEDPRIFSYRGRIFVIFNDNMETPHPSVGERREMYMAEIFASEGVFFLSSPIQLLHEEKHNTQWWQKNWVPFEWNQQLFFVYSIHPHRIIFPNLINGKCYFAYETEKELSWDWGPLRGSTPALLVDGEYLSFFHSGIKMSSDVSWGLELWHYFTGAYTFSATSPFSITKMSSFPIVGEEFYTASSSEKRVIFPGGYAVLGPYIYLSYGKDDKEMWIAILNKEALLKSLKPLF